MPDDGVRKVKSDASGPIKRSTNFTRRATLALVAGGLAAPAFAVPLSRKASVALPFDSLISPFWVAAIAEVRRFAAARGWQVLEAVSSMDDNRQFAQVQSMIQRKMDGIIMVHTDDKAVIPAIRAANRAGVLLSISIGHPPRTRLFPSLTRSASAVLTDANNHQGLLRQDCG